MYMLLNEAVNTALALKPLVANANHCDVVIAPVFTALKTISDRLEGSNISLAAQDCAVQNEFGAQTGAVSPAMLKDVGCAHVIIGHSERRQFCGENRPYFRSENYFAVSGVIVQGLDAQTIARDE